MSSSVYKNIQKHTEVQVYGDNFHLHCVERAPQRAALHLLQICLCPRERKKMSVGSQRWRTTLFVSLWVHWGFETNCAAAVCFSVLTLTRCCYRVWFCLPRFGHFWMLNFKSILWSWSSEFWCLVLEFLWYDIYSVVWHFRCQAAVTRLFCCCCFFCHKCTHLCTDELLLTPKKLHN